MKLEEMLKQQKKRGLKSQEIKAKMQSYDEYLKDDASPRPYNTSNVIDLFLDVEMIAVSDDIQPHLDFLFKNTNLIRDTNTSIDSKDIRDTNSCDEVVIIRDTESNIGLVDIRDTNKSIDSKDIRDTDSCDEVVIIRDKESNIGLVDIRDTNTSIDSKDIRDTNSCDEVVIIRDTESNVGLVDIRDTNKSIDSKDIRDTNSFYEVVIIRDTESNVGLVDIRDTNTSIIGRPHKGLKYSYSDLSGNAKKLIDEIVNLCLICGDLITPTIDKVTFSKNTGVRLGAIKTTICRLKEKGVISDYQASKGRHSSWSFTLSSEILDQYLLYRKIK